MIITVYTGNCKVKEPTLERFLAASTDDLSLLCEKERRLLKLVEDYTEEGGKEKEKKEFEKFK